MKTNSALNKAHGLSDNAVGQDTTQHSEGAENSIPGGKEPGLTANQCNCNSANMRTKKWLYSDANRLIIYYTNHCSVHLN